MSERTAIDAPLRFSVTVSWTEEPPQGEEHRTDAELQEHLEKLEKWAQEHVPREGYAPDAEADVTEVPHDE